MPDRKHHYLVSYGAEITIKGKRTRQNFVRRLAKNLRDVLESELGARDAFEIRTEWSRLFVDADAPGLAEPMARVFGVHAVAPAEVRRWRDFDHLVAMGGEIFRPAVRDRTFAVRVRRGAEATRIPFRSPEVEREVGTLLFDASAGVDLEDPQVEVRIELHGDRAFFFHRRVGGPGGLPVATEGRGVALLSGGFDSAVAAWRMLRRGLRLDYLFLNLGGDAHRDGVLRVAKVLSDRWSWGYRPRLHLVDFRPVVEDLKSQTPAPLWQVLLKRRMVRLGEGLAKATRSQGLVTGEALGQVSSQTLPNLGVVQAAVDLPILRPLISCGKPEIFDDARRIGTYELSARVEEYCGLSAGGPETHARREEVDAAEARLDDDLLSRLFDERAVLDLRAFDPQKAAAPDLSLDLRRDGLAEGARLLDLRSGAAYDAWHPRGARHAAYPEILDTYGELSSDAEWVAYCEVGLKSAHLAEVMAADGYRVRHVGGGFRNVVCFVEEGEDPALRAAMSPALRE